MKHSKHLYTNYFLYYRAISEWKFYPLLKPSIKGFFYHYRNELIWKLGLKRRPQTYIIKQQPFATKHPQ